MLINKYTRVIDNVELCFINRRIDINTSCNSILGGDEWAYLDGYLYLLV